jgi:hypothetical protein
MSDHTEQYPPHSGPDTVPAFRGLILGAVILLVVLFGIVKLTNAHFSQSEPAAAPAETK